MTRFGWWLLSVLARALEAPERDVVLGDLVESGQGLLGSTRDLLGLIMRRQAALWRSWRPWLALLGISCLAGLPLSRIVMRLNVDLMKHVRHFGTDLTPGEEVALLLCLASALVVWSWTCGFVLGRLSGRAVWLTSSVFYFVVLDSAWARFVHAGSIILRNPRTHFVPLDSLRGTLGLLIFLTLPLSIAAILSSGAALLGAFVGVGRRVLAKRRAYLIASFSVGMAFVATWTTDCYEAAHLPAGMPRDPWSTRLLPFLLVSWPAAYLCATAYRQFETGDGLTAERELARRL